MRYSYIFHQKCIKAVAHGGHVHTVAAHYKTCLANLGYMLIAISHNLYPFDPLPMASDILLWHATGVVDVCLIPEVTFSLDGSHGLMAYLQRLLAEKGHCVICVAEGAGQVCPSIPSFLRPELVAIIAFPCSCSLFMEGYARIGLSYPFANSPNKP